MFSFNKTLSSALIYFFSEEIKERASYLMILILKIVGFRLIKESLRELDNKRHLFLMCNQEEQCNRKTCCLFIYYVLVISIIAPSIKHSQLVCNCVFMDVLA